MMGCHEELARACALLQLQQNLIEEQALEVARMRLERDDALRTRFLLVQIVDEQRALNERFFSRWRDVPDPTGATDEARPARLGDGQRTDRVLVDVADLQRRWRGQIEAADHG